MIIGLIDQKHRITKMWCLRISGKNRTLVITHIGTCNNLPVMTFEEMAALIARGDVHIEEVVQLNDDDDVNPQEVEYGKPPHWFVEHNNTYEDLQDMYKYRCGGTINRDQVSDLPHVAKSSMENNTRSHVEWLPFERFKTCYDSLLNMNLEDAMSEEHITYMGVRCGNKRFEVRGNSICIVNQGKT